MATEPERKIEKLLRAYAQKRRHDAGQPPAPSQAMRERLQAEVARRFGSEPVEGQSWLERFVAAHWGKLAVASGAVVVLVIAVVSMHTPTDTEPAQSELAYVRLAQPEAVQPGLRDSAHVALRTAAASRSEGLSAPTDSLRPTVPTFAGVSGAIDKAATDREKAAGRELAFDSTGIEVTNAFGGIPRLSDEVGLRLSVGGSDSDVESSSAALKSRSGSGAGVAFGGWADAAAQALAISNAWLFKNVAAEPQVQVLGGRPAPAQILNTFRLEQRGELINVVDEDGSAYVGFVQPAAPIQLLRDGSLTNAQDVPVAVLKKAVEAGGIGGVGDRNVAGRVNAAMTRPGQVIAPAWNYFFRVTGTNRALNQPVVFTGQLVVEPVSATPGPEAGTSLPARGETRGVFVSSEPQATISQAQAMRVLGTAVLGHTQAISINAVSLYNP